MRFTVVFEQEPDGGYVVTVPALALAQSLFGDDPDGLPDRAAEIVAQNRVRHPLFVAGGETLSVLAREGASING